MTILKGRLLADRKCIVVESPLGPMARQRRVAVSKSYMRSQTRPPHPPVTGAYFPEAEESSTRGIDEENGNLEGERGGVERERAGKADGVGSQGEERELGQKEKKRDKQARSRKGPTKSKAKTVTRKEKPPSAHQQKNCPAPCCILFAPSPGRSRRL